MKLQLHRCIAKNGGGFTLVELMIVVAIIAILGAIAIPAYNGYITNSKQQGARTVLEQIPLLIETYRAENGRMCPLCTPTANTAAPIVYSYTEDAAGVENTVGNKITVAFPDFKPKPSTQTSASLYSYSISFTTSGCAAACLESAAATAIAGASAPPGNIVGNSYK